MRRFLSLRDFDWVLLSLVLLLSVISVFEIYSATMHTKFVGFHKTQIIWLLGGLVCMFGLSAGELSPANRLRALRVHRVDRGAAVGDGGGDEGAGSAAVDQVAGRHSFSAIGVGKADPDCGGGAVLCDAGWARSDLE